MFFSSFSYKVLLQIDGVMIRIHLQDQGTFAKGVRTGLHRASEAGIVIRRNLSTFGRDFNNHRGA